MCEIKQFPEAEKMSPQELAAKELEKNGSKVYQISLTCEELEIIRHVLGACREFFDFLNSTETVKTKVDFGYLENKVFQQFYDEDGKLR